MVAALRFNGGRPKTDKVLSAVAPNVGITVDYRRRLLALVDDMTKSYLYWVRAAYRRNQPATIAQAHDAALAQDASPTIELKRVLERLGAQWEEKFNAAAPELAAYFAQSVAKRSDKVLAAILKKAGISVRFKMTKAMRDVVQATTAENVQLIKSIPQQYLTKVQGAVMRSVAEGRDLASLYDTLRKDFGSTRERAALISRDQNNKATANIQRARQIELGIEEAVWLHSQGGRVPRKTHLANTGKRYNVATGWFDPDPKVSKHIWPGQLINCRCVAKPVIKGFS